MYYFSILFYFCPHWYVWDSNLNGFFFIAVGNHRTFCSADNNQYFYVMLVLLLRIVYMVEIISFLPQTNYIFLGYTLNAENL